MVFVRQLKLGVALFLILLLSSDWCIGAPLEIEPAWERKQAALIVDADSFVGDSNQQAPDDFLSTRTGLIGVLAIGLVIGIGWWARRLVLHSNRYTERVCPKCGGEITRIRRKQRHRIEEKIFFIPIRRYACKDPNCGWVGLRFGTTGESEWRVRQR